MKLFYVFSVHVFYQTLQMWPEKIVRAFAGSKDSGKPVCLSSLLKTWTVAVRIRFEDSFSYDTAKLPSWDVNQNCKMGHARKDDKKVINYKQLNVYPSCMWQIHQTTNWRFFFLIFPRKLIWHCLQIVSLGDSLPAISDPDFWKKKNTSKCNLLNFYPACRAIVNQLIYHKNIYKAYMILIWYFSFTLTI